MASDFKEFVSQEKIDVDYADYEESYNDNRMMDDKNLPQRYSEMTREQLGKNLTKVF